MLFYIIFWWITVILLNSIMDASDRGVYSKFAKQFLDKKPESKFRKLLWEWTNSDSWDNKYEIRSWMIKRFPTFTYSVNIYTWLAKDVLVIFLDLWHFAKAIMSAVNNLAYAILITICITESFKEIQMDSMTLFWIIWIALFLVGGTLFNIFYYTQRKIAKV